MFKIKGPILAAIDLDDGSDDLLLQADALARSHNVRLSVCHVLPEIFAVQPLFPQLHLDDALKLSGLEAAVRDALLERIQAVTTRKSPQVGIAIEQGTVHAGILRAAERIGAGAVVVGGKVDPKGLHILGNAAEHVVRYAHCPVLVARPSPAGKVLAATDFSDPALPAVEAGAAEARRRKADLTILHVIDLLPVISPYYGEFLGMPPMDLGDRMSALWQARLDACVHQLQGQGRWPASQWTGGTGDLERGVGTAGAVARRGHSWQDGVEPRCPGQRGGSRCARRAVLCSDGSVRAGDKQRVRWIRADRIPPACAGGRLRSGSRSGNPLFRDRRLHDALLAALAKAESRLIVRRLFFGRGPSIPHVRWRSRPRWSSRPPPADGSLPPAGLARSRRRWRRPAPRPRPAVLRSYSSSPRSSASRRSVSTGCSCSPGSSTRSSSMSIITVAATGRARSAPRIPISVPPARSANRTTDEGRRSARP